MSVIGKERVASAQPHLYPRFGGDFFVPFTSEFMNISLRNLRSWHIGGGLWIMTPYWKRFDHWSAKNMF